MNVLVIYTHPDRQSLNGAFLDKVLQGLDRNERVRQVSVLDLYGEGFDPVLRFGGDLRRRDLHQHPDLERHRQLLKEADQIVLVYPIWWGRPPAMLQGFFDRVLAAGFAYRHRPGKPLPEGLLKNKKVTCISTMQGPGGYPQLWLGNAHRNLMRRAVWNFVGVRTVRFFEFGSMEKDGGKQKHHLGRVEDWAAALA